VKPMKALSLAVFIPALLGGLVEAQSQGTVSGPVTGYVFDRSAGSLRPVLGLPGGSLLGTPIGFGLRATAAFVAPHLDSAVVVAVDKSVHLFRIQNGAVAELSVAGLNPVGPGSLTAFSPSGSAVALYAAGSVQILSNLPDAPAIAGTIALGSHVGPVAGRNRQGVETAGPQALAVSDDGVALLVSIDQSIRLFASNADLGQLMGTAGSPVMAFAAGNHDAAVDDPGSGLVVFHDLIGTGSSQVVMPSDQGSPAASALAFSADEKTIFLASFAGQTVTQLDLTAGALTSIPCNCAPTALARMGNVFRLTDLGNQPLWLLDAPEANPRVVFVPALVQ
jgi:hypothetical protein